MSTGGGHGGPWASVAACSALLLSFSGAGAWPSVSARPKDKVVSRIGSCNRRCPGWCPGGGCSDPQVDMKSSPQGFPPLKRRANADLGRLQKRTLRLPSDCPGSRHRAWVLAIRVDGRLGIPERTRFVGIPASRRPPRSHGLSLGLQLLRVQCYGCRAMVAVLWWQCSKCYGSVPLSLGSRVAAPWPAATPGQAQNSFTDARHACMPPARKRCDERSGAMDKKLQCDKEVTDHIGR